MKNKIKLEKIIIDALIHGVINPKDAKGTNIKLKPIAHIIATI
jgi:hypothetical protein